MATYKSRACAENGVFARGIYEGIEFQRTGEITIPAGVKLTDGDFLKFVRLGENVLVRSVRVHWEGDLDDSGAALVGTIGRFQILDSAGDPLAVSQNIENGTVYTSPSTAAAVIATAVAMHGARGDLVYTGNAANGTAFNTATDELFTSGTSGPVDLGIEITTSATGDAASAITIRFTVDCLYKAAPGNGYAGDPYRYQYDSNGSNGGLVS